MAGGPLAGGVVVQGLDWHWISLIGGAVALAIHQRPAPAAADPQPLLLAEPLQPAIR